MKQIYQNGKLIAVFGLLLTGVFVWTVTAGDLNPPAAPIAGTMKTLDEVEPRIAISDDNTPGDADSVYKITEPGSYYLTGNVYANGEHGIMITADDVTLDLMGFKIWASYETSDPPANLNFDGIYIDEYGEDVEIRNGVIESTHNTDQAGFRYGIYSPFSAFTGLHTKYLRIYNVRVFRSRSAGIATSGYYAMVKDCHSAENGSTGISVIAGTITNCVAYQNDGSGISASNCVVTQCKSLNNYGGYGIALGYQGVATENSISGNSSGGITGYDNCVISRNAISTNSGNGIETGDDAKIENNTVASSGGVGIETGNNCVVTGNTVSDSDGRGLSIGDGTLVDKNSTSGNGSHGMHTGAGCIVTNNTAFQNTHDGIVTGLSNVVKNNNAYENGNSGISVTGYGSSLVGNTARKNQYNGIDVTSYCLVDQNATYGNNQAAGAYDNLSVGLYCEVGMNVAP